MSPALPNVSPIACDPQWGQPCMTGAFVIGGVTYPTYAYSMQSSSRTWPVCGGIYSVSGVYDGNEGRNLVGKTAMENGFRDRWLGHRNDFRSDDHGNPYAQASFNNHPNEFVFWALETGIPEDDLGKREAFWYNYLESDKGLHGWNIQVPTDDGTCKLAEETKQKLKEINLGNKHTPETRAKMSATRQRDGTWNRGLTGPANPLYGRKLSPERCLLLSKINSGPNNPHYGKHHTDNHRQKISAANPKCIPVRIQNPQGEVESYHSVRQWARQAGLCPHKAIRFLNTALVGASYLGWTKVEKYVGLSKRTANV